MSASDTSFVLAVSAVVVGVVVVVTVVVTSVVGAAVVSGAFFLSFPQAATISADSIVTEVNKILFFIKPSQMYFCYYFIMFQIILKEAVERD